MKKIKKVWYISNRRTEKCIPLADIIYCEANDSCTNVYCTDGSMQVITRNIGVLEQEMKHECMFRSHRSYIVNLLHVERIEKKDGNKCVFKIIMNNGAIIDCARNKRALFKKMYKLFKSLYSR